MSPEDPCCLGSAVYDTRSTDNKIAALHVMTLSATQSQYNRLCNDEAYLGNLDSKAAKPRDDQPISADTSKSEQATNQLCFYLAKIVRRKHSPYTYNAEGLLVRVCTTVPSKCSPQILPTENLISVPRFRPSRPSRKETDLRFRSQNVFGHRWPLTSSNTFATAYHEWQAAGEITK